MINTAPTRLRSGTIAFSIGSTNSGFIDIADIGELQYEFALKSAESAINTISIIPGAMSLSIYDTLNTGASAYDHLSAELSGATITPKNIPVTMTYTPHGATASNTFAFQLQYQGLQYDIRSDRLTLQLLPPLQSSESYVDFFSNMTNVSPSPAATNLKAGALETNYVSYRAADFIKKYVRTIDPSGVSNVFASGYNSIGSLIAGGFRFNSPGYDQSVIGETGYALSNIQAVDGGAYDNQPVSAKVLSLAAIEGAIVGSAFSVNFYVNRMTNSINRSLSNSDITDIRLVQRDRQVNAVNIFVNTINVGGTFALDGIQALPQSNASRTFQTPGWQYGTQFVGLDLIAHAPHFGRGKLENDGTNIIFNATSTDTKINNDFQNVVIAGAVAYQSAFGAVVNREYQEIEVEVLGVSTIKPHEAITFDSTAPSRVQGKHFRPASLTYDFKGDKVKVRAYEIP